MGFLQGVNNFMGQDDTIQDFPAFDITRLFQRDDPWQDGLESSSNHFGQEFVDDVAQSDGMELHGVKDLPLFGDEGEESHIKSWEDLS